MPPDQVVTLGRSVLKEVATVIAPILGNGGCSEPAYQYRASSHLDSGDDHLDGSALVCLRKRHFHSSPVDCS